MIVILTAHDAPRLTDLDNLDRLHAETHGAAGEARFSTLCDRGDADHVWLHIDAARSIGAKASDDPTFAERFDAMIAYARRKGWSNAAGTHIRAHIETAD